MPIYLVDDDAMVLRMLERMLEGSGVPIMCFQSAPAFVAALETLAFGTVVLDVAMPELDGLSVLDAVLQAEPAFPVVMASGSGDVGHAIGAFRRGAVHFLRKPYRRADLLAALAEADSVGQARLNAHRRRSEAQRLRLSGREREVLAALAEGEQSKVIAHKLGLSVRTVDMHRSRVLAKLSARNASQAVAIARQFDLLAPA